MRTTLKTYFLLLFTLTVVISFGPFEGEPYRKLWVALAIIPVALPFVAGEQARLPRLSQDHLSRDVGLSFAVAGLMLALFWPVTGTYTTAFMLISGMLMGFGAISVLLWRFTTTNNGLKLTVDVTSVFSAFIGIIFVLIALNLSDAQDPAMNVQALVCAMSLAASYARVPYDRLRAGPGRKIRLILSDSLTFGVPVALFFLSPYTPISESIVDVLIAFVLVFCIRWSLEGTGVRLRERKEA